MWSTWLQSTGEMSHFHRSSRFRCYTSVAFHARRCRTTGLHVYISSSARSTPRGHEVAPPPRLFQQQRPRTTGTGHALRHVGKSRRGRGLKRPARTLARGAEVTDDSHLEYADNTRTSATCYVTPSLLAHPYVMYTYAYLAKGKGHTYTHLMFAAHCHLAHSALVLRRK
ncbi:hypothetical protein EVAR_21596_1 [Eumeta japonica]|uniref:Uncharacterized protein n=1 Tax=Eumeta variegata TaxID=151549 RepID=A0A4C1UXH3_EUMVA|nr:hypothetical protein EVAR_21596_1 [Eumeta japonica]